MSELDYGDIREIADVLFDHYYSIGTRNGVEAVGNLIDDYTTGLLDTNLVEWGVVTETGDIDRITFQGIIFWSFIKMLIDYRPLHEPANWRPNRTGNASPAPGAEDGAGDPDAYRVDL